MTAPAKFPEVQPQPRWRRVLPFLVAAALVAFVLSRLDFAKFFSIVQQVNYFVLGSFALLFLLALLVTDCYATREVYRRTIAKVEFKSLLILRGASYLPSILSHHLGQAWLTYFLSKVYGAPLWRVAGATLLVYVTILGGLALLTGLALPLQGAAVGWLAPVLAGVALLAVAYLTVVYLRPGFLRRRQATAPLVEVGVRGHLVLVAYRIPHLAVLFVGNWIPFELYGIHIPLADALMLIPVIMLVSSLPITPQGVGTRDALALQLLSRFASGTEAERAAALAAATLSFAVSVTLMQLLISPLFLSRAQQLLGVRSESPA